MIQLLIPFNLRFFNLPVLKNSKILIENIFCNIPNPFIKIAVSGNISSGISDYFPQFFILADIFPNSTPTKYDIKSHEWENLSKQLFLENFGKADWDQILQLNGNNVNLTVNTCLNSVSFLINIHAPLKKLSK